MSNINFAQIQIQGRLTEDPKVSTLDSGTVMCKFRVAVNRKINKETERTSFIPVTVFGKDAVNCGEYLTKGRVVMVSGEFETDNYEDRDGNKRTGFGVIAAKVIFGSGGRTDADADTDAPDSSYTDNSRTKAKGHGKAMEYMNKNRGRGYDQGR